jgi:hypothetical protein
MAATIVGNNTITWGSGGGGSLGKIQSASHKKGGDKVELLDENGEVFCVVYFNQKDECEFTAIFLSSVTLPNRGDTITIGGVANCRVDDYDKVWENTNAMKFTIRATKYANIGA